MWVQKWSKMIVSKFVLRPLGVLKQVFLARFQCVVTSFGPPKIPKSLEDELFWDQKWVKNGSTMCFSKNDLGAFGLHKQVK